MSDKQSVFRFQLNTGRCVYMKEMTMIDEELATQKAGSKGDNDLHTSTLLLKEYAKIMIVAVGDSEESEPKKLTVTDKENFNNLFTYKEYAQIKKSVEVMISDEGNLTPSKPSVVTL